MKLELIATSTFGLEAVVKREIENLGYKILKSEDGKITFLGDERAVVRANLWLRCADRVQIKMGEFKALEFEELFQQVKGVPWEEWIPVDGKFVVNGSSVKSKLSSVPACQSVAEKAVVERLKSVYGLAHFEKSGALYEIKISLLKDQVTVTLDTTGPSLHKRGYRIQTVEAPMKETMAAALVQLSFWKRDRLLLDPCCGSGTIAIEAALIGRNIAPGLNRHFTAEEWEAIDSRLWKEERKTAFAAIDYDSDLMIYGRDMDRHAIENARANAEEAGVDDCIDFQVGNAVKLSETDFGKTLGGVVVTNPPYGERIGDQRSMDRIYEAFRKFFQTNPTWSLFMITSDKTAELKAFGRQADRRRKLFNGRLEVCYYQFHGEKPPKKMKEREESRQMGE
ncbi:MAG: class I SAM-dependent RNA methyltransferase [Firmicutes bacterium]|nr:class I SAM-dependent RNA methyltransferase [Bacillota bacterium]